MARKWRFIMLHHYTPVFSWELLNLRIVNSFGVACLLGCFLMLPNNQSSAYQFGRWTIPTGWGHL